MRTDLMLRGAELLEADAINPEGVKFNLSVWAADARMDLSTPFSRMEEHLRYKPDTVIPVNCGTQACAMGLFAISGAFAKEGLSYRISDGRLEPIIGDGFITESNWLAAMQLFDISEEESFELFSGEKYPLDQRKGAAAELAVAARMREMVAEHLKMNTGVINQTD